MSFTVNKLSLRNGPMWEFRDISFEISDGEVFGIFGESFDVMLSLARALAGESKASGEISPKNAMLIMPLETRSGGIFGWFGEGRRPRAGDVTSALLAAGSGPIVLFEPFIGVTETGRDAICRKIREKAEESGNPILIAASGYRDIAETCGRAAVMSSGYIIQTDTPQTLYDHPASSAAAKLTGTTNLIEARRLTSSKSELPEFITIGGEHRIFAEKADLRVLGAINKNVDLSIRPEQISISFGASFPEDNLIRSTIVGVRHLGPYVLLDLDASGLSLVAAVPRLVGIGVGEECMVGLPPDRLRILCD